MASCVLYYFPVVGFFNPFQSWWEFRNSVYIPALIILLFCSHVTLRISQVMMKDFFIIWYQKKGIKRVSQQLSLQVYSQITCSTWKTTFIFGQGSWRKLVILKIWFKSGLLTVRYWWIISFLYLAIGFFPVKALDIYILMPQLVFLANWFYRNWMGAPHLNKISFNVTLLLWL